MAHPQIDEFLKCIEYPDHALYKHIDDLFVPPVEYETMKRTLEEKRVLFLVSKWGCGATFTAVKLMWEFFQRGYTPQWMYRGREVMENKTYLLFEGHLRLLFHSKSVAYIEDPFGKVFFGRENSLGVHGFLGLLILLETIYARKKDIYVIISTNADIYHQLEAHHLFPEEIEYINHHISPYIISYDWEKLHQLLFNWGNYFNCKWAGNEEILNTLFNFMKKESLPFTPLNIKDLALRSRTITDATSLMELTKRASVDPSRLLAEDIASMSKEEKYFFSRFLLAPLIDFKKAGKRFEDFFQWIKMSPTVTFESILTKYRDTIVNVVGTNSLELAHPSYFGALNYILQFNEEFKQVFNQTLAFLANKKLCIPPLIWTIWGSFELLPPSAQNIILQFVDNKEYSKFLIFPLIYYFVTLPGNIRKLLLQLASKVELGHWVSEAVAWYFHRLPKEVSRQVLEILASNKRVWGVAGMRLYQFDDLFGYLLGYYQEPQEGSPSALGRLYRKMPDALKSLVPELEDSGNGWGFYATRLVPDPNILPEKARNILLNLAKEEWFGYVITGSLVHHFDLVPEEMLEKLCTLIEGMPSEIDRVVAFLITHYNELPQKIRDLIFKFSDFEELTKIFAKQSTKNSLRCHKFEVISVYGQIVGSILRNYSKLPSVIKNMAMKMMENDDIAGQIEQSVAFELRYLPEDVGCNVLEQYSKKYAKHGRVLGFEGSIVEQNFNYIPEPLRTQMIIQLKGNYLILAKIFVKYFDNLTPELRVIFDELVADAHTAGCIAREILSQFPKVNHELAELLLTLVKNPKILSGIAGEIVLHYASLSDEIRRLVFQVPFSTDEAGQGIETQQFIYFLFSCYSKLPGEVQALVFKAAEVLPTEVAGGILRKYEELPEKVRVLLPQLFEISTNTKNLVSELDLYYKRVPKALSTQLIHALLSRGEILGVLKLVLHNYALVEEEFKSLPFSFAEDATYQGDVAYFIAMHYKGMTNELKNLFFKISENASAGKRVAEAIIEYYSHLPEEVRQKIFEFIKQGSLHGDIGEAILIHSEYLPDEIIALLPSLEKSLLASLESKFAKDPKQYQRFYRLVRKNADPRISPALRQNVILLMQKYGDEKVQEHLQRLQENAST